MSNNDEKKLGKSEYFELREKRLKLVYRILYVIVAIWIAALISIGTQEMTTEIAPMYAFLLAASSLLIINIIKYSLMEFRCMKVVGNIEESLFCTCGTEALSLTEMREENIQRSSRRTANNGREFIILERIIASLPSTKPLKRITGKDFAVTLHTLVKSKTKISATYAIRQGSIGCTRPSETMDHC